MVKRMKVRATEDHFTGPFSPTKCITKGEVFEVMMRDNKQFVCRLENDLMFGVCTVGYGFEIVEEEVVEDLAYLRKNAQEDCVNLPSSVLRYLQELEKVVEEQKQKLNVQSWSRPLPSFKDEWGNSDWRDKGEMGG